ncbi:MAG: hypothetical protein V1855_00325 [bacterium]
MNFIVSFVMGVSDKPEVFSDFCALANSVFDKIQRLLEEYKLRVEKAARDDSLLSTTTSEGAAATAVGSFVGAVLCARRSPRPGDIEHSPFK